MLPLGTNSLSNWGFSLSRRSSVLNASQINKREVSKHKCNQTKTLYLVYTTEAWAWNGVSSADQSFGKLCFMHLITYKLTTQSVRDLCWLISLSKNNNKKKVCTGHNSKEANTTKFKSKLLISASNIEYSHIKYRKTMGFGCVYLYDCAMPGPVFYLALKYIVETVG